LHIAVIEIFPTLLVPSSYFDFKRVSDARPL